MCSVRWLLRPLVVIALALAGTSRTSGAGPGTASEDPTAPPPVELTAEQDHQRLMDLLRIESIRPGADPRNPQAPNAVNYDEAKANPYPSLPDPLVLKNGKKVTTASTWWSERRPEILEDFDREIYGRVPKDTPRVSWEVTSTAPDTVGGVAVITKKLVGHVDNSKYPAISVDILLTLTTPASATGPVPVMLELGFDFGGSAGRPARPPGGASDGPTWQEQLASNGWGYAILSPNTVQPDNGAGLTRGIIGLVNEGQPRKVDDWGALRAWAWGASRALDYLGTDKAVDARHVGIEGLSRYGKAALVTMAYDPRFAIAFVASSGEGGAKLHRRSFGELVENVAGTGEYHWMAGNFIKYAGPLTANDLPVDAHELIALCAPRPVFISSGSFEVEGGWVDAKGMFLAAVRAGPVYRLLGKKDLGTSALPTIETALIDGDLAFRQHRGGHTAGPNWPTFLEFAERFIKTPALAGPQARHWLGTWASSPQLTEEANLPPAPGFADTTLRQIVHVSIGGQKLRPRFSNAFGTAPLTLVSAHVARSAGGGAIDASTDHALTFHGQSSVTIPPGASIVSDPLDFDLPPLSDLAVTVYLRGAPAGVTGHPGSRTTSYLQAGEAVSAAALPAATRVDHWYFLSGIDVLASRSAAAIAILGDSITDGRGSTTNGNDRWPDNLARRLQSAEGTAQVAVLNHGIGGNRLLRDGLGPSALARLDRDVLAQPGVRWLIVLAGINDIGTRVSARAKGESAATAADIIAAYEQIIVRAHARDIRVYGATILPFEGASSYFTLDGEADRQTVNNWIRTSGRFDGVIDFDAVTRDPGKPSRLSPAVDGGDHLHPSAAGYKIMADAIDLKPFAEPR